jgi:hypothetical protein
MTTYKVKLAGVSSIKGPFKSLFLGNSRILTSLNVKFTGRARIQNNALLGYAVFVGEDSLPDLSIDPTDFSATLPVSVPITPPGIGTKEINVVVRKRNSYGLYSKNQMVEKFTIDSSGDLVARPVTDPGECQAVPLQSGKIKVMGTYPTFGTDTYPATEFRIWIGTVAPDTDVDVFDFEGPLYVEWFSRVFDGPYSAGTYHVAICLYRSGDMAQSAPSRTTVIVPSSPSSPVLF